MGKHIQQGRLAQTKRLMGIVPCTEHGGHIQDMITMADLLTGCMASLPSSKCGPTRPSRACVMTAETQG